jgi:23S rRNA pseudouridine2605 synthase
MAKLRIRMQHQKQNKNVGLARALSKLGFCSRAQAVALIRSGRVQLNGATPRNPETPVRMGKDRLTVDGRNITAAEKIYVAMNKPRGFITTASDEKGRATVFSLLPENLEWLAPVGRLDKASEGLLLFTNDSEWAARVTAPETHLNKTYHVQVSAIAGEALIQKLESGVPEGGELLRAKSAKFLRSGEHNSWIEIALDEGKNRQIRRMLEHCGLDVLRLVRVAIGPLQLGDLAKGAHRTLSAGEKAALDRAMHGA